MEVDYSAPFLQERSYQADKPVRNPVVSQNLEKLGAINMIVGTFDIETQERRLESGAGFPVRWRFVIGPTEIYGVQEVLESFGCIAPRCTKLLVGKFVVGSNGL